MMDFVKIFSIFPFFCLCSKGKIESGEGRKKRKKIDDNWDIFRLQFGHCQNELHSFSLLSLFCPSSLQFLCFHLLLFLIGFIIGDEKSDTVVLFLLCILICGNSRLLCFSLIFSNQFFIVWFSSLVSPHFCCFVFVVPFYSFQNVVKKKLNDKYCFFLYGSSLKTALLFSLLTF